MDGCISILCLPIVYDDLKGTFQMREGWDGILYFLEKFGLRLNSRSTHSEIQTVSRSHSFKVEQFTEISLYAPTSSLEKAF